MLGFPRIPLEFFDSPADLKSPMLLINLSTRPGRSITQSRHDSCIESRASRPLILTSTLVVAVGGSLTVSPLAKTLGFVPLPPLYWLFLAIMLLGYAMLTQVVKTWFIRRFGE